MPTLIKEFLDGSRLEFDKGAFDAWCIYLKPPQTARYPPRDVEYFSRLQQLAQTHTHQKIYNDFVRIYDMTTKDLTPAALNTITEISSTYGNDVVEMDILLTTLYAGMVAEENKEKAILKKRIKRLGMYQALIQQHPAAYAAQFSRNKWWRDLDTLCKEYGF